MIVRVGAEGGTANQGGSSEHHLENHSKIINLLSSAWLLWTVENDEAINFTVLKNEAFRSTLYFPKNFKFASLYILPSFKICIKIQNFEIFPKIGKAFNKMSSQTFYQHTVIMLTLDLLVSETDNQTNWPKSTRRKGELIMRTIVVFKIDAI